MTGVARAHEWRFKDELWQQDATGKFQPVSRHGAKPNPALTDLDYALAARRCSRCSISPALPASFTYCPHCGAPLQAIAYASQHRWLPPYGNGDGWRSHTDTRSAAALLTRMLDADDNLDARRQEIKPPRANGLLYFVSNLGGHRDALFALSRAGDIFLWQRGAGKWLALTPQRQPIGRSSLEPWAWGAVMLEGTPTPQLLLAGDNGALRLEVDSLSLSYRLDSHAGHALAAPGELNGQAFVPLLRNSQVVLASPADNGWTDYPLEAIDAQQLARLSAPIANPADRQLLWIGENGYLELRLLDEQVQATWHPWPNGQQANPQLGPPFRDGEGLWQLLFEETAEGIKQSYLKLGSAFDERKPIQGWRLGTGHINYQFNILLARPWDDYDRDMHTPTQVLYPFVEFANEQQLLSLRVDYRGPLQRFFDNAGEYPAEYCVERIGERRLSLKVNVSRPWNAQWFFFDDALWLSIDSSGALYRWNA